MRHLDPLLWIHKNVTTPIPPGREFVPSLLDEFEIIGPNGTHRCIVTEVVGPTVDTVKYTRKLKLNPLPAELAWKATVQCIKAVAFLHSRGVVHGVCDLELPIRRSLHNDANVVTYVDLHIGNIALGIPQIDTWTVDELYDKLGTPTKVRFPFEDEEMDHQEGEDEGDKHLNESDKPSANFFNASIRCP
jgi:hypothetical protein